jgi:hypothetical protein
MVFMPTGLLYIRESRLIKFLFHVSSVHHFTKLKISLCKSFEKRPNLFKQSQKRVFLSHILNIHYSQPIVEPCKTEKARNIMN